MTQSEEKQKQSSSIHQKIRNASFVSTESEEKENFINSVKQGLSIRCAKHLLNLKRRLNSIVQKPALWASFIDWRKVKRDAIEWLIESAVEGFIANFVTHFLIGRPFTPMTVMAHGFAIKLGIDIYWRLKKHGPASKLPTKDN